MKKKILLAAALSFIVVGTAQADSTTGSYNVAAGAGITGSKHDLSVATGVGAYQGYGSGDELDRICIFCHAPHHAVQEVAAAGVTYLPLWNHGITTETYNTYQSDFGEGPDSVEDGDITDSHLLNADIGQPGSVSRLCLSCHDGTVAVDTYGNAPQRANSRQTGDGTIVSQFRIGGGGNLANHHPIGFNYDAVAALDAEIAASTVTLGNKDGEPLTIASLLYNGDMECVTCHDVHNSQNTGETFLWRSDRESKFCLVCHIK